MKSSYLISAVSISALLCACSSVAVSSKNIDPVPVDSVVAESNPTPDAESTIRIGGWAPVFFSGYNQNQVNEIVDGLNNGRIKKAVVSYPTRMQTLALKIHDNIQKNTTVKIPMESVELKDTDQVKYDLKQVIVTLYFN